MRRVAGIDRDERLRLQPNGGTHDALHGPCREPLALSRTALVGIACLIRGLSLDASHRGRGIPWLVCVWAACPVHGRVVGCRFPVALGVAASLVAGVLVAGGRTPAAAASVTAPPKVGAGAAGLEAPDAASALAIARLQGERVEVVGGSNGVVVDVGAAGRDDVDGPGSRADLGASWG